VHQDADPNRIVTNGTSSNPESRTVFDEPRAIAAALIMGAWGNLIFMSAPFLVGSLVDTAEYTEQHAGWIFSADMAGLALGSIITYLLVNRCDRRYLAAAGMLILFAGNALSLVFHELSILFPIRVFADIGSGILYAISIANLSGTHRTARNFSILLVLILLEGAIEALILPVLSAHLGVNGIFFFFIAAGIVGAPFILWLCPFAVEKSLVGKASGTADVPGVTTLPRYLPIVYLLAIVTYTVVIGAVWTYIERAGISAGIAPAMVSKILSTVNLMGIIGALVAVSLSNRWGQGRMLLATLFGVSAVFTVLAANLTFATYVSGLIIFNILWVLVNVYQMGTLANLDHTGRYGALVPAAQDVAVSAGSPIAGAILAAGFGYSAVIFFGAGCALLSFFIFLPAYLRVRTLAPEIADAP
jgi:predicted MFS family arabinose efflux permease